MLPPVLRSADTPKKLGHSHTRFTTDRYWQVRAAERPRMADDHGHDEEEEGRTTAPQSEYTTSQVGLGFAVALVGLVVVFGLPLALTL